MSRREDVGGTLKAAVTVILRAENREGGWRYQPQPTDSDLSVTAVQVVALVSAKEAGIVVPDQTIQRALAYVHSHHNARSGGFGYWSNQDPTFSCTAGGSLVLTMCGQRNSKEVESGLDYLMNQPESVFERGDNNDWYFYGHYYAAQMMFQAGDERYRRWYPRIRDASLKSSSPTAVGPISTASARRWPC